MLFAVFRNLVLLLQPAGGWHVDQSLFSRQCALVWLKHHSQLKDDYGDGIVIGSSSVQQLEENPKAVNGGPLPQDILDALEEG